MRLLATTSHSLLLVDTDSGAIQPLHRDRGLYYGIAHQGERIYVAARNRLVSSSQPQDQERGEILVFDKGLRCCDRLSAPFPLRDIHEIAWHGGKLWITCSFDDMVAVYDGAQWQQWFPLGPSAAGADLHHFNSFMFADDRLWLLAHNKGASDLLAFSLPGLELIEKFALGNCGHNIWRENGQIFSCSSLAGELLGEQGFALHTGGFPRGVAFGQNCRCVGISTVAERKDRDFSTGKLMIFDQAWQLKNELELPGEGLILDLLPLPDGFCLARTGWMEGFACWLGSVLGRNETTGQKATG